MFGSYNREEKGQFNVKHCHCHKIGHMVIWFNKWTSTSKNGSSDTVFNKQLLGQLHLHLSLFLNFKAVIHHNILEPFPTTNLFLCATNNIEIII